MGPALPQKLRGRAATLGALSILTIMLRCYVRTRLLKAWRMDDTFIILAFVVHMWYTGTLLTGIHFGTGQRTADISTMDSVHAMRCWWLCFLAYASTITLAKISAGFFFLRVSGTLSLHRISTIIVTTLAALVGSVYFFVSLFQCHPIDFFWTRLQGATNGKCMKMDVIIGLTYLYGSVAAMTDVALGLLVAGLVWNLKVDRRTKLLIAPFLAMACLASYAAIVRMPYIKNFKDADFLCICLIFIYVDYSHTANDILTDATVDISLWSTIEVGVSVVAANLATLRPFIHHMSGSARSWSSRLNATISSHYPRSWQQELEIIDEKT